MVVFIKKCMQKLKGETFYLLIAISTGFLVFFCE